MNLRIKAAGCAALAATAVALVGASAAGGEGNRDVVAGGGVLVASDVIDHFSVGASSEPDGSNARGEVRVKTTATLLGTTEQDFRGDVSRGCMIVTANQASVVGELPESQQFTVPGAPPALGKIAFLSVNVHDNGHPMDGQPVDQASAILLFEATAARLCAGTQTLAVFPLEHGNFVVIDS